MMVHEVASRVRHYADPLGSLTLSLLFTDIFFFDEDYLSQKLWQ